MKKISLFVLFILSSLSAKPQGIVVNEISNGVSGSQEFIELLVIGSSANPTSQVDINGWIFDDNNGDFEGSTNTGVAQGHYRFVGMPLVSPGDLIVIYNTGDVNPNIPPNDPFDLNGDDVYILPINSSLIERCSGIPSSTTGPSYTPCTYTSSPTQTWFSTGFRNSGDAVQTRQPDFSFYHGFSYGDVLNVYPTFPNGKPSFNIITGSGTGHNYYLDCGDWTEQTNYQRGDANFDTPGLPNTGNNSYLINMIKSGTFDYTTFDCTIVLNENRIVINEIQKRVFINSEYDFDLYDIYISDDGIGFKYLSTTFEKWFNVELLSSSYIKCIGLSETEASTSNIIYVNSEEINLKVFPNPAHKYIKILTTLNIKEVQVFNEIGSLIFVTDKKEIGLERLSNFVILRIITEENFTFYKKIIIND